MGVVASRAKLRNPILSYPIEEWIEKMASVDQQIEAKGLDKNINIDALACTTKNVINNTGQITEKITFAKSKFDILSDFFKDLKSNDRSFITIFKSDAAVFYEKPLEFDFNKTWQIIPDFRNHLHNNNITILESEIIPKIATLNTKETDNYKSYLTDINNEFVNIINICSGGKPVCTLNYSQHLNGKYHTTASVFWLRDGTLHCNIYDPMYYVRETGAYIWAIQSFVTTMHLLSHFNNIPVQVNNLSEMCYRSPKGPHCAQYIIDAEYCMVYALYFIYLYAAHGFPTEESGIQEVINSTFVGDPAELKRNPCLVTNHFRLVFMSFALNVLYCLSGHITVLHNIMDIFESVKQEGYELLDKKTFKTVFDEYSSHSSDPFYLTYQNTNANYKKRLNKPQVTKFLSVNPNYNLVRNYRKLIQGRTYKVHYRNKNNSYKNFNGSYHNRSPPRYTFINPNDANNYRTFDEYNNNMVIFQKKRGKGGKRITRRRN